MDRREAFGKYLAQKKGAARRGIDWQFTFETWLAWWGDDLESRGTAANELQMQRFHDKGPYHPSNCRKGTPKRNSETAANCRRRDAALAARKVLEAERDASPCAPSKDIYCADDDEWEIVKITGVRSSKASFLR